MLCAEDTGANARLCVRGVKCGGYNVRGGNNMFKKMESKGVRGGYNMLNNNWGGGRGYNGGGGLGDRGGGLSSDNHLVDGQTDRQTDMSKAIYPLFFKGGIINESF
ncbi:hypothetical protein DPMN_002736 [Dreissena polymorpha]|uniref:Uncharacterized protein n=1 Tax=Dreissena polymorpha TaxID=45954 RepID=A0A9D4RRI5_DREPO|nr:hypothetical protein DPMN_002736 [Dreissena polymorpha]